MPHLWGALIGALGGLASGLFGVGGGLIFVPLLVILLGFDIHVAIGTSLAVIIPTALAGLLRHGLAGKVDWTTAAIIAVFAILGAWLGAGLSLKINEVLLRRLFAFLIVIIALKLFFKP